MSRLDLPTTVVGAACPCELSMSAARRTVPKRPRFRPEWVCVLLFLPAVLGCPGTPAGKDHHAEAPAKVEKVPQETELARVTLTAEAAHRLGIATAPIRLQSVTRRRILGGEVTVPLGKSIVVAAPVSGTIVARDAEQLPVPGQRVTVGDTILTLDPLLSPERDVPTPVERVQIANARATLLAAQTVAQGDVERSRAEVEAAQIALDRAKQLLADKAGAARAVDEAQGLLNVSLAVQRASEERARELARLAAELDQVESGGRPAPLRLTAPQSGLVRTVSITPGQKVTAGTALFEVVDIDTIWLRVPVYVGLLNEIASEASAQLIGLDGHPWPIPATAQPIVAPPSADPLSTSADLFYELDNRAAGLRPGQRVGVQLELRGASELPVIEASAVLYDIYGGTWVYERVADHAFERRRVRVQFTEGDLAVLSEGPAPGVSIVVEGNAELFGTEFGAGK